MELSVLGSEALLRPSADVARGLFSLICFSRAGHLKHTKEYKYVISSRVTHQYYTYTDSKPTWG